MQRIIPNIWCNGTADEARDFYLDAFSPIASTELIDHQAYPTEGLLEFQQPLAGQTLTNQISIGGFEFILVNAGAQFAPNPSINFFVNFDPSQMDDPRGKLDALWARLIDGGQVLMELGEYPFSAHYGWVTDRFGVNWQLMLTNPAGEPRPLIIPQLMFCGQAQNNAREAVDHYVSVFDDARWANQVSYPEANGTVTADSIVFSDFTLLGEWFSAMDSAVPQPFTFSEGISLMVQAHGQEELDRLWEGLSAVPEAEQCGWLKDRWGVSWQIVPDNLGELMANSPDNYLKLMGMKKIQIDQF